MNSSVNNTIIINSNHPDEITKYGMVFIMGVIFCIVPICICIRLLVKFMCFHGFYAFAYYCYNYGEYCNTHTVVTEDQAKAKIVFDVICGSVVTPKLTQIIVINSINDNRIENLNSN